MVKEIPLQNGMIALVDDEDFERVSEHTWTIAKNQETSIQVFSETIGKKIILSRFISKARENEVVTFKNKNPLDFRKENLIVMNSIVHKRMSKAKRNASSKYKGVCKSKKTGKWIAAIAIEGKRKHLGSFINEDDAARTYNNAVLEYWGGIGYLNVIGEDNSANEIELKKGKKVYRKRKHKTKSVGEIC